MSRTPPIAAVPVALPLRRRWLGRALLLAPWVALAGCASTWPEVPPGAGSSSARQRLRESAEAHGAAAWAALHDVNLAVDRLWIPGDGPAGPAQVRWLPAAGVMALQSAVGEVRLSDWRRRGATAEVRRWRDGAAVAAPEALAAAAVLADLHRLLWLGPIAVTELTGAVNWAEPETLDGRRCDHLNLALVPGLGAAASDRLSLFIDREEGWLRRLRVSMSGLGTAGEFAEVDFAEHRRLHGVLWPMRCQANTPRGIGRPAAIWRLTALDANRGYAGEAIAGPAWTGLAAGAARPLPPG